MKRVGHQIAARTGTRAEIGEDRPMPLAWRDEDRVRLLAQKMAKRESRIQSRRWMENPRVGNDSQKAAENQFGYAECFRVLDQILEPLPESEMINGVFAMRVDEHVDVGENHGRPP